LFDPIRKEEDYDDEDEDEEEKMMLSRVTPPCGSNRCTEDLPSLEEQMRRKRRSNLPRARLDDGLYGVGGGGPHPLAPELPLPHVKPPGDELFFFDQDFDTLESEEYWLKICPHLHVGGSLFKDTTVDATPFDFDADDEDHHEGVDGDDHHHHQHKRREFDSSELKSVFDTNGYVVLPPSRVPWGRSSSSSRRRFGCDDKDTHEYNRIIAGMARGICLLMQRGLPPWFIAVYDEAWLLAHQLGPLIKRISGGNGMSMSVEDRVLERE